MNEIRRNIENSSQFQDILQSPELHKQLYQIIEKVLIENLLVDKEFLERLILERLLKQANTDELGERIPLDEDLIYCRRESY